MLLTAVSEHSASSSLHFLSLQSNIAAFAWVTHPAAAAIISNCCSFFSSSTGLAPLHCSTSPISETYQARCWNLPPQGPTFYRCFSCQS
ncbi:hypothetical protein AOLI_G00040360 [Acnodon oligacanthus]